MTTTHMNVGGQSDFTLSGHIENYIPYVFSNKTIKGNMSLYSKLTNVSEIMSKMVSNTTAVKDTTSLTLIRVPKNIDFVGDDLCIENGKSIPRRFVLQAETENATLNVTMKVLKIHHVKMMLRMHYWRFHVSCKGSLNVGSEQESVDETQIAEFIRFR